MSATSTPARGIRLRGGVPVPLPPSFGRHKSVNAGTTRLGGVVELEPKRWVPVCVACYAALEERDTDNLAAGALYRHWDDTHSGAAA